MNRPIYVKSEFFYNFSDGSDEPNIRYKKLWGKISSRIKVPDNKESIEKIFNKIL